ncbi:unnamed protein product [Caenorhabditis auriculariae]|uniref:Torsin-1A C-terminal domain-containing protein n=1 Tax=Caenorhabditis auriculariae TaxID=2777116 RepID=A0A8S1HTC2_9PELO|nr:unnamed protein product [Caenorhabditis auriculariae]
MHRHVRFASRSRYQGPKAYAQSENLFFSITLLINVVNGELFIYRHRSCYNIKCHLYECCDDFEFDASGLDHDLSDLVFGQHLVKDVVVNAMRSHWSNKNPKKPLVMSFHGYTGSGKNYVAEIIANNTFKSGIRSSFVNHIVATSEFPDRKLISKYQVELRERILSSAKKSVIKPFLDYYNNVHGVDFRRCVFLFLSNRAGAAIADHTVRHAEHGLLREALKMEDFERVVMEHAFNEPGGLKMSELISNHLIDHFIPFLPLQREHVKKCVEAHLVSSGHRNLIDDVELLQSVLNSLQYFPEHSKAFSSSGCKRVDAKTDLELSRRRITSVANLLDLDDEL